MLYNDWIIAYDTTNYNDTFAATELRNFLLEKTNGSLTLPLVSPEPLPRDRPGAPPAAWLRGRPHFVTVKGLCDCVQVPLHSISSTSTCNVNTTQSCKFIAMGDPSADKTLGGLAAARNLALPADLNTDEGYLLEVGEQEDPNGNYVMILAKSAAGRYFGVQTLLQMINSTKATGGSTLNVPAASIVDWPEFPVRGFLMSGLGERYPSPFFYADAARMTRQKMNFAFLEFMQNVPYAEDQYQMMLDIQAHCKQRHMYIVPQVPAGAPCNEIDSRSNEGMWARSVPFTAPSAAGGSAILNPSAKPSNQSETATLSFLMPKVLPVIEINGDFKQLKAGGKVPSKWQFLPSSSGIDTRTR